MASVAMSPQYNILADRHSGGMRHDLTPEKDIRDAASKVAMVDFNKRGNRISEQEGEGLPTYGNIQLAMIAEQNEHRFDKPLDPMSPRRAVALTQSASDAFTHTVLLVVVVTLYDLSNGCVRGRIPDIFFRSKIVAHSTAVSVGQDNVLG